MLSYEIFITTLSGAANGKGFLRHPTRKTMRQKRHSAFRRNTHFPPAKITISWQKTEQTAKKNPK
jgi:hypothetical protein